MHSLVYLTYRYRDPLARIKVLKTHVQAEHDWDRKASKTTTKAY